MASKKSYMLITALGALALFQIIMQFRDSGMRSTDYHSSSNIVISSPVLTMMYAGDRFLAANFEAIRVAAIGPSNKKELNDFRIRSHTNISMLNACHEDNMYLANSTMSWGGAVESANTLLRRATQCRFWDDVPPFFLGFNQYFFGKDIDAAQNSLELAASRSENNRANLQKISIMMATKSLNDLNMAIAYLRSEHDQSKDNKLKAMLNRRLGRLVGLQSLRDAQSIYEQKFGRPLKNPNNLLTEKILDEFPTDPMGLGYDFKEGVFKLRELKMGGVERPQ